MILQLIFLAILILLNAYFAATEIAFISLNDAKIEKQAKEGNTKAKQTLPRLVCLNHFSNQSSLPSPWKLLYEQGWLACGHGRACAGDDCPAGNHTEIAGLPVARWYGCRSGTAARKAERPV